MSVPEVAKHERNFLKKDVVNLVKHTRIRGS